MERSISITVKTEKALTDKPKDKTLPRDKSLGLDPPIHFYEIKDFDNTEEG